jgi:DNA-directed RNA polymerase subunit RPC12/RpoP
MPTCSCPHCGRSGIPFEMHEAHSRLQCAKCDGFFTPLGGPVQTPRRQASPGTIRFACPTCRATLNAPLNSAERQVSCPKCKRALIVPKPPSPKPAPVAATGVLLADDEIGFSPNIEPPDVRGSPAIAESVNSPSATAHKPGYEETPRPGKVLTIGILLIVAGGVAILGFLGNLILVPIFALVWPGTYYALVTGILAIIKGCRLVAGNARAARSSTVMSVLMIVNIINCNVVCLVLGIICLVFSSDSEVKRYFHGH